jgi:hypothetical protein
LSAARDGDLVAHVALGQAGDLDVVDAVARLGQAAVQATLTEFKDRAPGLSGKEAATDVPSWIENWPDARPGVHENGTTFATRMMNKRYGVGAWKKAGQHNTEFSQLKKFADRAFE